MALTLPDLGLKKKLNPLGQVMDTAGQEANKNANAFKGLPRAESAQVANAPYDYKTATSPFTKENAPKITGAISGGVTTSEMKTPLQTTPQVQQTAVSSMAGRTNIPKPDTSMIPVVNAGELSDEQIMQGQISPEEMQLGKIVKESGGDRTDFFDAIRDFRNGKLDAQGNYKEQTPTSDTNTAQEAPKEGGGFWNTVGNAVNTVGQPIQNVVGGAISEVASLPGKAISLVGDINKYDPLASYHESILGKGPDLSQVGKNVSETGKGLVEKYGAYDPNSIGSKVGQTATDLGASMVIPGGVLKSGVGLVENIARSAVQGAIEMGKYTAVSEGRLPTAGEAGAGALVGGAIPAIGAGLSKAKNALQLSGLVTPAKLDLVKNMIKDEGGKSPDNVAKWMQDRNIWGTKDSIIKQLDAVSDASKGAVDASLASVKKTYDLPVAKQAVNQIFDKVSEVPGLEKETVNIVEQFGKKELNLSELNALKRKMDDIYDIYKASSYGDPKAGLVAKGLNNMRTDIKKFIETQAKKEGLPNISELNNQTAVAKALSINIGKKESSEAARELLTMFAPSGVGAGLGAVGGAYSGDPYGVLKGAVIGGLAGSTFLKTGAAKILSKLTPSETKIVKSFIESRGAKTIPDELMTKMKTLSTNKGKNVISPNISRSSSSISNTKLVTPKPIIKPTKVNPLNLSKNKKGMINPSEIGKSLGIGRKVPDELKGLAEEAKKYKSSEEFVNSLKINNSKPISEGQFVTVNLTGKPTLAEVTRINTNGTFQVKYGTEKIHDYKTIEGTDILGNARMINFLPEDFSIGKLKSKEQDILTKMMNEGNISKEEWRKSFNDTIQKYKDTDSIVYSHLSDLWNKTK